MLKGDTEELDKTEGVDLNKLFRRTAAQNNATADDDLEEIYESSEEDATTDGAKDDAPDELLRWPDIKEFAAKKIHETDDGVAGDDLERTHAPNKEIYKPPPTDLGEMEETERSCKKPLRETAAQDDATAGDNQEEFYESSEEDATTDEAEDGRLSTTPVGKGNAPTLQLTNVNGVT